jgi:hypothetical protein
MLGKTVEWSDVIKTKWLEKNEERRKFKSFSTDGINGNIQFTVSGRDKPKKARKRKKANEDSHNSVDLSAKSCGLFYDVECYTTEEAEPTIIGVDPGRTCPMAASNGYRMTKGDYNDQCGVITTEKVRVRHFQCLPEEDKQALDSLSELSLKTGDFQLFMERWKGRIANLDKVFQVYAWKRLRRHRLYRRRKKTRFLQKMARSVTKGNPSAIIAYGNGKFPTSYRGARSGPGISLARYLAKTHRVVMVDEHLTSQTCTKCHVRMDHPLVWTVDRESKVLQHKTVHGVLQCPHCQAFRNRDNNASRNIKMLLELQLRGEKRPEPFRRKLDGEPGACAASDSSLPAAKRNRLHKGAGRQ